MISASSGTPPSAFEGSSAIRTTPAVCELEGPIITGPIISKTLLFSGILNRLHLSPKTAFYLHPVSDSLLFKSGQISGFSVPGSTSFYGWLLVPEEFGLDFNSKRFFQLPAPLPAMVSIFSDEVVGLVNNLKVRFTGLANNALIIFWLVNFFKFAAKAPSQSDKGGLCTRLRTPRTSR